MINSMDTIDTSEFLVPPITLHSLFPIKIKPYTVRISPIMLDSTKIFDINEEYHPYNRVKLGIIIIEVAHPHSCQQLVKRQADMRNLCGDLSLATILVMAEGPYNENYNQLREIAQKNGDLVYEIYPFRDQTDTFHQCLRDLAQIAYNKWVENHYKNMPILKFAEKNTRFCVVVTLSVIVIGFTLAIIYVP